MCLSHTFMKIKNENHRILFYPAFLEGCTLTTDQPDLSLGNQLLVSVDLTEVRVVSLVKEQLVAHSLHNDVPGVDWARAAHQSGQDGISGKHVTLSLSQLKGNKKNLLYRKKNEKQTSDRVCWVYRNSWVCKQLDTLRMTGSSVVVTVWKILLMLFSCFSLRVVIRSKALS